MTRKYEKKTMKLELIFLGFVIETETRRGLKTRLSIQAKYKQK